MKRLRKPMLFSRITWEGIQLVVLLWNCFVVPLQLCFSTDYSRTMTSVVVLNLISDVVYIMDLFVRHVFSSAKDKARLSALVMPEGAFPADMGKPAMRAREMREEHERKTKAWTAALSRYLFLLLDIISALPLDLIFLLQHKHKQAVALRVLKLARTMRISEQFGVFFTILERRRLIVNSGFHRMIFLWTVFSIFAHWFACGFYVVGEKGWVQDERDWIKGNDFFYDNTDIESAEAVHMYVRSIYWSITTMVTVGFGDIVPSKESYVETLFALGSMYIGMFLTCCVIGNLTNMVTNLDQAEDAFHDKMDNLNKYMAYRHLSVSLRERIRAYYSYMWTSLKGVDENEFLQDLPVTLRLQVAGLQSKDLVKQVPFLRKTREPIINAICVALEQVIVSPGDVVVRKGQTMQGCYWLRRGDAEVIGPTGSVLQTYSGKERSFFGESSLFFAEVAPNEVLAKSYCEFFFLKKERFVEILSETLSHDEFLEMEGAAEAAAKRNAKVKKFFGLDAGGQGNLGWRQILEPMSRFREVWNMIGIFGIVYSTIRIPYRLATQTFRNSDVVNPTDFILDWLLDFLFIADVYLRSTSFAYVREGIVVRDRSAIFRNYRKKEKWVMDALIMMPFDLVAAFAGKGLLPYTRIPKILVLSYLLRHYDVAQSYLAMRRFTITNALHRIVKIFLCVIIIVHFVGCGWMFMSLLSKSSGSRRQNAENCAETDFDWTCLDGATWPLIEHDEGIKTYLRAIYFVLVDMTTVGYGDIVPKNTRETAYVAIITLFGGLGYPAVVGAIAALISSLNTARSDFKRKLSVLNQYMVMKEFPRPLRIRITRYYDYLWSRQRGVDEQRILNDLPGPLRMEVQAYINGAIMRNIAFLQGVDDELLRHLFSVLKPSVFLPGDHIIMAGELGQDMFLLERGATRVTSKDGKMTFAVLTPGDYFGEGSLLGAEKRTANIIAIGYCDCFVLNKEDFDRVTKEFPAQRKKVIAKLKATLEEKKKRNLSVSINMENYSKLSSITSYDYAMRATISDSSFRHPESMKRRVWNILILVISMYNIFVIPFRICVNAVFSGFFVDFIFDSVLLVDLYLRMNYFGFVNEGEVLTDKEDVKANYRKTGKALRDVVTCFPLDLLAFIVLVALDLTETEKALLILACLRLPKTLLMFRVNKLVNELDHVFELSRFKDHDVAYRLFKLVVTVVSISHWAACFFYAIARFHRPEDALDVATCLTLSNSSGFMDYRDAGCPEPSLFDAPGVPASELSCGSTQASHCEFNATWLEHQKKVGILPQDGGTLFYRYLRALNWSLPTLVVVVIGDTVPVTLLGTVYVTVGIIIGVTINAAVIGSIANLVANLDGSLAKFREKMDRFERFLYLYRIPPYLQQRTRNYLEYLWETEKGEVQSSLVEDMPSTLRAEVSNFLKLRFVEQAPFFEFCDKALQKGIASRLHQQVYSPQDYIIFEGDIGNEMYFIEQGRVQMVSFRGNWRMTRRTSAENINGNGSLNSVPSINGSQRSHSVRSLDTSLKREASTRDVARRSSSTRMSMVMSSNSRMSEDDVIVLSTLDAGSYFGETAIFFNERRSCSVRAIEFTEVYALHKDDLDELLLRFPHESNKMFEVVKEIRQNNLLRNENVKANMEVMIAGSKLLKYVPRSLSVAGSSMFSMFFTRNILKNANAVQGQKGLQNTKSASSFGASSKKKVKLASHLMGGEPTSHTARTQSEASNADPRPFRSRHRKRLVIKPHNLSYKIWNVLSLFFTLYMAISIPFRIAFLVDPPGEIWAWFAVEYLIDIFFLADIVLRLRHFAINKFGRVITDQVAIAAEYRATWFWIDLLASLPLDFILLIFLPPSSKNIVEYSSVRLIRLIRLLKVPFYVRFVDRYLNELIPRINSAVVQTFKLFILMFMLNHWYACTWFMIHRFLELESHSTWAIVDGLATYEHLKGKHNIMNDGVSPLFCYLRAIYFTVATMSSVGYGDIRPYSELENLFELLVVLTGACILAALIGSVAVVYLQSDSKGDISFKNRLRKMIDYMQFRELPFDLQKNIVEHFTNSWERFEGVELSDVISDLPLPLRLELSFCIHQEIIQKVRGLRHCHVHVQRHIARKLVPLVTSANDYVYREGEIGSEIYFILSGEVMVIDPKKKSRRNLREGQHFGGDTVYSVNGERTETVECVTDCELYFITKDEFESILLEFPEHRSIGIFAEIIEKEKRTVRESRELHKQVAEISGKVKDSPLAKFSAKHIDSILGSVDTSFISSKFQKNAPVVASSAGEVETLAGLGPTSTGKTDTTNMIETARREIRRKTSMISPQLDLVTIREAAEDKESNPGSRRQSTAASKGFSASARRASISPRLQSSKGLQLLQSLDMSTTNKHEDEDCETDDEPTSPSNRTASKVFKSKIYAVKTRKVGHRASVTFEDAQEYLTTIRGQKVEADSRTDSLLPITLPTHIKEKRITEFK